MVPRIAGPWVFNLVLSCVLGVMLISFVAVPARIIGVKTSKKLPPREVLGGVVVSGAVSAVAMTPGFLLARVGLILLGAPALPHPRIRDVVDRHRALCRRDVIGQSRETDHEAGADQLA